jgi:hypothetical protein
MGAYPKYTKEALSEAAAVSLSIAGVLRHLGIPMSGGMHAHISRRLRHFDIDTSHFLGSGHQRGKRSLNRLAADKVLVVRAKGSNRVKPQLLRRAVLEIGVPYSCAHCGLRGSGRGSRSSCTSTTSTATTRTAAARTCDSCARTVTRRRRAGRAGTRCCVPTIGLRHRPPRLAASRCCTSSRRTRIGATKRRRICTPSGSGGIGRRPAFRSPCLRAWGFESPLPHRSRAGGSPLQQRRPHRRDEQPGPPLLTCGE